MKRNINLIAAVIASVTLAGAGAVYAQGGMGGSTGHAGGMGGGGMSGNSTGGHMGGATGNAGGGGMGGSATGGNMGGAMGNAGAGMGANGDGGHMMGNAGMGYGMGNGMAGPMGVDDGGARMAGRLAALKADLKITPKQEPSWLAYENTIKQQSAAMQTLRSQMQSQMHSPQADGASTNTAALRDGMMALRDANQTSYNSAVKDLNSVLTPEQKSLAKSRL